ncbi:MAG: hypothetical protein WA001_04865 [Patescibacteria group bacterium]
MQKHFQSATRQGQDFSITVDSTPDICPICHFSIEPLPLRGFCKKSDGTFSSTAELVFLCPRQACERLFIARYKAINPSATQTQFEFLNCLPIEVESKLFSSTINATSPKFQTIWNQSFSAEQSELTEVCGPGYRKALEFLVKDYAKTLHADKIEQIEKCLLSSCITQYIDEPKIQKVAERAAWLGNDETHYVRTWESKDLDDLKKLIDMVVHLIDAKADYDQLLKDMPKKPAASGKPESLAEIKP